MSKDRTASALANAIAAIKVHEQTIEQLKAQAIRQGTAIAHLVKGQSAQAELITELLKRHAPDLLG
jgi:hypothetical protein